LGFEFSNTVGMSFFVRVSFSLFAIFLALQVHAQLPNEAPELKFTDGMLLGWEQLGADIDGEAEDDRLGFSVSLSADGRTVAVGAIGNAGDTGNSPEAGRTKVFHYDELTGLWEQLGQDIDGEAARVRLPAIGQVDRCL